jgi:hypothetical protein
VPDPIDWFSHSSPGFRLLLPSSVCFGRSKPKSTSNGPSRTIFPATGFQFWLQELYGLHPCSALALACHRPSKINACRSFHYHSPCCGRAVDSFSTRTVHKRHSRHTASQKRKAQNGQNLCPTNLQQRPPPSAAQAIARKTRGNRERDE